MRRLLHLDHIGTIQRQKTLVHDDEYIVASNTWGPPDTWQDLWACCDDADDCVGEDVSTAADLGRCIAPYVAGGNWLCGTGGNWYECRPLSAGAAMGGYICVDNGGWVWELE